MSLTAIGPIESAVHTTNAWLKEVANELGWQDRERAYHAMGAVLHALRDRLTVAEAADLGAQLPTLIRGLYYDGWNPNGKPVKERRKEDFLAHIATACRGQAQIYPEEVAWGVFNVLQNRVSAGEIADVKHVLPLQICSLWPEGWRRRTADGRPTAAVEPAMKTIHDDAETIRRRMALIRRKHHEDVRAVLAGAEKVAGWGRHVRLYTWVALGVAAGFWMVTHRRRTVPIKSATGEIVTTTADKTEPTEVPVAERSTTFSSLLGGAASFLTTVAIARLRTMRPAVSKSASLRRDYRNPRRPVPFLQATITPSQTAAARGSSGLTGITKKLSRSCSLEGRKMGIFDQASVKSMRAHPSSNGSTNDSDHGVAEFIDDLVTLAELQVNLTVVDFKETARKAAVPLGLTLVSLTVIAASVPVVLFGLALLLAATLNIHQGWAMILAAAMAVALACPMVILCVARLRSGFNSFRTSREEFRRNLLWLRNVLARRHAHHRRDV